MTEGRESINERIRAGRGHVTEFDPDPERTARNEPVNTMLRREAARNTWEQDHETGRTVRLNGEDVRGQDEA